MRRPNVTLGRRGERKESQGQKRSERDNFRAPPHGDAAGADGVVAGAGVR